MLEINEVDTISKRIVKLVDYFCKGNKTAFGRAADIQSGVLAGIVGERGSKPGFELLQKMLTAYPTVSPDWLLFGHGRMLRKVVDSEKDYIGHIGRFPVKSARDNPEVPIIAGNQHNRLKWDYLPRRDDELPNKEEEATYALSNTPYAYESLSLPASMLKPGLSRAFPISDASMEPSFGEGDLIIATQLQNIDWTTFPRESDSHAVIDTFPVCVVEVWSEKWRSIEIGRFCIDATGKSLICFKDNRFFHGQYIPLNYVKEIWEFNSFLSKRALNPAQELVYKTSQLEQQLLQAKKSASLYIRLKHRIRELILAWNTSMKTLSQDFNDYKDDEQVRQYYSTEVGIIDDEEEYGLKLLSIIHPLIIELTPTLEADSARLKVLKREPGMPPPLSGGDNK
ncbi:hypothetical protein [Hymenobacter baengnokdamensis]|uniref:hypothetical protein n=1 Tax=Hymenobacter baengnokdamensis TaxID=2615203 RepID=UPI001246871C|nr:hypothetical protein [Hymenobacter baengnokdamensis]